MERLGWLVAVFGLMLAGMSAFPFVYTMATTDDPTLNPAPAGVLMVVGGFVGLLVAAVGGCFVVKGRTGRWPPGF